VQLSGLPSTKGGGQYLVLIRISNCGVEPFEPFESFEPFEIARLDALLPVGFFDDFCSAIRYG
jgi:hypothetical protein